MTLALQVENKASGSLDSGISDSATSMTLKAGEGAEFPSASGDNYFYATLQTAGGAWEVVKVTAKSTDTFTIERNVDSSIGAAQAFSADDIVSLRYCASVISDIVDELNDHADDHDSRFFTEIEHINISAGAADAGKPITLDSGGLIDDSMIDEAGISHSHITDDESEKHRLVADSGIAATELWSASKLSKLVKGQIFRSLFEYKDTDEIYVGSGQYVVDGKHAGWSSQLTSQISTPSADTTYYLYLDYSEITTDVEITATELIWSTTAPAAYDHSKRGCYNGDDLCIFSVRTDGSGNILKFYHDGDRYVELDQDIEVYSYAYPNTDWSTQVTFTVPAFCVKAMATIEARPDNSALQYHSYYRQGASTGSGHRVGRGGMYGGDVREENSVNTMSVFLDDSFQIDIKVDTADVNAKMAVYQNGWFLPAGM